MSNFTIQKDGISALSDVQILAAVIGSQKAADYAAKILLHFGSIREIARASFDEVAAIVGNSAAGKLCAACEVARRRDAVQVQRPKISRSQDAYDVFMPYLSLLKHEEFYFAILNRRNTVIKVVRHSIGGNTGTMVDSALIIKECLLANGTQLMLAHNHPSNSLKPSGADLDITKKIKKAAQLFEISLLDHIIVTDDSYYSFADNGEI